jgi:hypothetical protein
MLKIIESFTGDTEGILGLRAQINTALESHNSVKVKLWQPGIMYQQNNEWLTVIDFINEWQDRPVIFYSNLVPLRDTFCEFRYTNDMFISDHKLYENNTICKSLLQQLKPIENNRKYYWDFLFGQHKPLKDQLYQKLLSHSVEPKVYHTYFKHNPKDGCWSHGYIPHSHSAETIDGKENAFDNPVRHSDLIDTEIYNQSYYSAVIETVIHNDFAMFSEKEAKPIMAQRPFVIFGACHQLRAFRSLGFQTFSSIIDESYDDIEECHERFDAVLNSMEQLTKKDPIEVYQILNPVLEHNKKHFLENKWTKI